MNQTEKLLEVISIKQVTRKTKSKFAKFIIRSPEDAAKVAQHFIGDEANEIFLAICLTTKNEVIAIHKVHSGSLNASIVHPRESFKASILNNAASIIFAHNHPSYNCQPSSEDLEVTKRLVSAGQLLGIEVLDSLIVSPNGYTSLKEKGYV